MAFPEAKKGVVHCARLRKAAHWPNNKANPSGLLEKKVFCVENAICAILSEKTPFLIFPEAKKAVVHCARLHKAAHWLIITQIPRGYQKKKFIVKKNAICAILSEKTPFLAFPEAKKGVVHCASLRKAAHWPNNKANPSGLLENKVYCVEKRDMCDP